MEQTKSKVYVKTDSGGRIVACDGGYTVGNVRPSEQWTLIDEGTGDRYNLCQSLYFPEPLAVRPGVYRYKLADGRPQACTAAEIASQEAALPVPEPWPTAAELVEAMAAMVEDIYNADLAEIEEG